MEEAKERGFTVDDIIQKLNEHQESQQRMVLAREVQIFRCKPCRDKSKMNITIASRSLQEPVQRFIQILVETLERGGGVVHYGLAPPSHTEQQLKSLLEKVEREIQP